MFDHDTVTDAAHAMSSSYRQKRDSGAGEPEASLRSPLETFVKTVAASGGIELVLSDEAHLGEAGVRPDYAVFTSNHPIPVGYLEVKGPGKGVDTSKYTGHDREQWEKLRDLPNVLYTDGQSWAWYRFGERPLGIQDFEGPIATGDHAPKDVDAWATMLESFLCWQPEPPASLPALAATSARMCRLLKAEVTAALETSAGLRGLSEDWRKLLFPKATDDRFADQYAQTVTFALLLARAESIDLKDRDFIVVAHELKVKHGLLGVALQLLTDDSVVGKLRTSLSTMQGVIGAVDWSLLLSKSSATSGATGKPSPWLHFYEDFLAEYDPDLRKRTGSYYTPDPVVDSTVRLIDEALRTYLSKPLGLAAEGVTVVDPAVGTGTYLLKVVDRVASTIAADKGGDAVAQRLAGFAHRMVGFEIQTGPFAVAQMRLAAALAEHMGDDPGALPAEVPRLYVADTLEDPYVEQTSLGSIYEPISRSREQANKVKADERVVVVLGNPPYRNQAKGEGGWVEKGNPNAADDPLLKSFQPSDEHAPSGNQTQELRNLYVYFLRWAVWKAFEAHDDSPHGVVAFITASAWLTADGLVGVREHIGEVVDHVYIVDLGGQGRSGRNEDNVFDIKTPVAITVLVRDGSRDGKPPTIHYRRVRGSRAEKYKALQADAQDPIQLDGGWIDLPIEAHDPWTAGSSEAWARHPKLEDLFPWAPPGVKPNRTWVYAPDEQTLLDRWARLTGESDDKTKKDLFKESYHAKFDETYPPLPGHDHEGTIKDETGPPPALVRVGFRSFTRQWLLADRRLIHSPSPSLWRAMSDKQIFVGFNPNPGHGPAITLTESIPDMPYFQGNATAGGSVLPLWRDRGGTNPNVAPGLMEHLRAVFPEHDPTAEDLLAYCSALLAHSGYTKRFWDELETPGVRVPLTTDAGLWHEAVQLGREVIWVHTYGERCADSSLGRPEAHVRAVGLDLDVSDVPPDGPVPESIEYDETTKTLHFGDGAIAGVPAEVWRYEVSGMQIIDKWFGYRRAKPKGRKSSDLDKKILPTSWSSARTDELFRLVHVLGRALELEPLQEELMENILAAPLITVGELTEIGVLPVPDEARRPPTAEEAGQTSLDV